MVIAVVPPTGLLGSERERASERERRIEIEQASLALSFHSPPHELTEARTHRAVVRVVRALGISHIGTGTKTGEISRERQGLGPSDTT